jgi:hypothetical protein
VGCAHWDQLLFVFWLNKKRAAFFNRNEKRRHYLLGAVLLSRLLEIHIM